jgi:predicted kinase
MSQIVDVNDQVCTTPTRPWLVFTAGSMGAGKSYTIKKLMEENLFPMLAFVGVDPDVVRRYLPEYEGYVQRSKADAGEFTRKESGFIVEILTEAALREGKNVLVDGSLRDHEWYTLYIARLRASYPNLRIAILHISAPPEVVYARARRRGDETGRYVPETLLQETLESVPRSVSILSPLVDYVAEFVNDSDGIRYKLGAGGGGGGGGAEVKLGEGGEAWDKFHEVWMQTCKWVPKAARKKVTGIGAAALDSDED